MKTKGVIKTVTDGALIGAGVVGGRYVSKIPFLASNPYFGVGAQLLGAVVFSGMKGPLKNVGLGMGASATLDLIKILSPSTAANLGISGIRNTGSTYLPGVAGNGIYQMNPQGNYAPRVVVK